MNLRLLTIIGLSSVALTLTASPQAGDPQVKGVESNIKKSLPAHHQIGVIKVQSVVIDPDKQLVTVNCNETLGYISLTPDQIARTEAAIREALPESARGYKLDVKVNDRDLSALSTERKFDVKAPTETTPFIIRVDAPKAPAGLDGANIAMWQSHGWYYEPKLNRWEWQRARIFQTVEDLYTQSYVMPFLMPMLENAGAYVMSPRERDTNLTEIIVDPDGGYAYAGYAETVGKEPWTNSSAKGFAYARKALEGFDNPFTMGGVRQVKTVADDNDLSKATWSADFPEAGDYAVYVSYTTLPESAPDALYRVNTAAGPKEFKVNQKMGGGTWIYLGHFPFAKGRQALPVVELVNKSAVPGTVVTADAVKIGGGMGNVARKVMTDKNVADSIDFDPVLSNYPRFTEAARYWLQWAGMPDSVYSPSNGVNDYTDDYRSRGLWVNYLAGGSSVLPGEKGLNIPVDLSFAFHTDAGTTKNDSIIGTLSIYCSTGDTATYANGTPRMASRRYTDLIATTIVDDIRANYEPNWTRRAMWDKSYFEARVPEVPAMLLELLSHQNFADMKYGLDPTFRFTVSRAIYKGMLKFLAERDGRDYVVQPLPVNSFSIAYNEPTKKTSASYTLSWLPTEDKTEPTAAPTYYIVYERVNDGAFVETARVDKPAYTVSVTDSEIHSYKIVAANDGGISFPSEVLALRAGEGKPDVMIVNGFTRISAPDTFDSGEIAGFYDARDHGVPYLKDISFIGSQFEFRRDIPWMDDDAAGFGASRADYEDKVVAGNTFDYVYDHGVAVAANGGSFISSSLAGYIAGGADKDIRVLDLILGKQKEIKVGTGAYGTKYKSFPVELQNAIKAHCDRGGSVFVSGAYVATDLWDNPYSDEAVLKADQKFATDVLGYHWRVGQASVTGDAYEVQSRFKAFNGGEFNFYNVLNSDCYAVESPDSFYSADKDKGATIMRYGENNLVAGTAFDNSTYRTVVIGFPFETIKGADAKARLMGQVLNFFKQVPAPAVDNKAGKKNKKSKK